MAQTHILNPPPPAQVCTPPTAPPDPIGTERSQRAEKAKAPPEEPGRGVRTSAFPGGGPDAWVPSPTTTGATGGPEAWVPPPIMTPVAAAAPWGRTRRMRCPPPPLRA